MSEATEGVPEFDSDFDGGTSHRVSAILVNCVWVPQHAGFASTPPKGDDLKHACRRVARLRHAELTALRAGQWEQAGEAGHKMRVTGKKVGRAMHRLRLGQAIPIDGRKDGDKFWDGARVVGYTCRFHSCVRLHDVGGSCVSRDVKVPLQLQTCSHPAGGSS